MKIGNIGCGLSERVNNAVAHPLAFPVFIIGVIVSWVAFGLDATNFAISILTAGLLFLMATADAKRSAKMEKEIDALAHVHPEVDEQAIAREVG